MGTAGLVVDGIRKVFTTRHAGAPTTSFVAVDDVSFALAPGEALAVVGESGSGKTTVARIVAGIEVATAGTVSFDGVTRGTTPSTAERRAAAKQIQMVFQDPYSSLDPRQSGEAALDEVLRLHSSLSAADRRRRIRELGERVGLGEQHLAARPRQLSGGQRQRLAIARSLAVEPQLLILDEAVSALDVSVQAQILNLLVEIRRDTGLGYLFVSHDLAVVRQLCERVIVLRRGVVVEAGATADVLDHPTHEYTRLLRESVPGPGWQPRRLAPPA